MAEAALVGIAKALLTQLASPAIKEFKLLWGQKTQLEKLENTINTIKNVLQDADRRQSTEAAVQGWLARLRVVLYDADDLFDAVSYKILHEEAKTGGKITKQVYRLFSKPYHFAYVVKLSQKVKAIRERLDDIAKDINQFNFIPSQSQTDQEQPYRVRGEQTHSYIPISEVVGRDRERDDIVKLLLPDNYEDKRGFSVVAVIGIGGLGKTTLGQLIYNDKRVQQGFDLCVWCCVNYFSDLKGTLEAIVKAATKSAELKGLDLDQLQSLLRKTFDGQRFLLVLDDVWDDDALNWRRLQILLDSGKDGSMALVTTRSVEVAQSMCAAEPYYHLQGLEDESAWLLFKKIAFGEESEKQNCPDLEELGRQIVKKCGNAPLAIVIVASLLRHKERNKWFPLVNDELSKVVPAEHGKMMQVLKMSYNELSSPVKRCFAYCSLFSKDAYFDKDALVSLWIAQGFVKDCAAGQSLEDVAEDYFFCLVNRCFIQNSAEGDSFKMHDLVHDLAIDVARPEIISVDKIGPNYGDKTLRHVSLSCALTDSSVEQLSSFSQSKRLRTLLFNDTIFVHNMKSVDKLISCFKAMRVLRLGAVGIEKIPDSVGQLIHLRYLDLSHNRMKMLPSSVCMLHLLECLFLSECEHLEELPRELGKLTSLRRLEIEGCKKLSEMPQGLTNLTSLVALDRLIVHNLNGGLSYLECLDNLSGSLSIELPGTVSKNTETDAQKACLSKKHRLRNLRIQWESEVTETADTVMNALQPHSNLESLYVKHFGGKKFPGWISEVRNLVSLTIVYCGRCVELPSLRHLQFLKVLHIEGMPSLVVIEEDCIGSMFDKPDSIFFPSLETLLIYQVPNLTSWWKHPPSIQPAFHRAVDVRIQNCPKLTTCVPLFPQVEDLVLGGIHEYLFWQVIRCDRTNRLKSLKLENIHHLRRLPGIRIRHLSTLQKLTIIKQRELAMSFKSDLAYLTSLEKLKIMECERMEWIDDDGVTERSEMRGEQLPRLERLKKLVVGMNLRFKLLKYMTSLEELTVGRLEMELPRLEEEEGMIWKSLQKLRVLKFGTYFGRHSALLLPVGVEYLNYLQKLTICYNKEVYLSWEIVFSLPHLRILTIEKVEKVIDVGSTAVHRQVSPLQELSIRYGSEELMQGIPWRSFSSLRSLYFWDTGDIEALPEGIQHLTALQSLRIWTCKSVVSLPHWMTNLTSLRSLDIVDCSEELKERCRRLSGEDWPKIQHIPLIQFNHRKA